jgi:hypothetical protein
MSETNDMGQWGDLLSGKLTEEEIEPLVSKAVADLHTFLESEPQAEQRVLDILGRRLGGQITSESWDDMSNSLAQYLGPETTGLLWWVVEVEDPNANRLQEVEKYNASLEVMAFLRTIVGTFGLEMSKAFDSWNRFTDEWSGIHREVYYDQINKRYHFRVRIEKYNGEMMTIEGDGISMLTLTSHLIRTVKMVGTRDAFDDASITQFFEQASELVKLLTEEEEKTAAEVSDSQSDTETPINNAGT